MTITEPPADAVINAGNARAFLVAGDCTAWDQAVVLGGAASASVQCEGGVWHAVLDLSNVSDGAVDLTVDHQDSAGRSAAQFTRHYTKDTQPPQIAFAVPAAGTLIAQSTLSAVVVSGSCTGEQDVTISGAGSALAPCQNGSFSATFDLTSAPDGSLFFYATQRDAAANASAQVVLGLVKYTRAPAVTIVSPANGAFINGNVSHALTLLGACSEIGQPVVISGDANGTAPCLGGLWNIALDVSALGDGTLNLHIDHASADATSAPQVSRSFVKDAHAPVLTFSSPSPGALVSTANMAALPVSGSCTENGTAVTIAGAASASAVCQAGVFTATVDASALPDGSFTLYARQQDAAGNNAQQAALTLRKDTTAPTVSFFSPAAGSLINASKASSFLVSGHCSEAGRDVRINGSATATVSCNNGFFNALLDFSAANDGAVTITADHDDSALSPALTASRGFVKDTTAPTLAFTSPAPRSYVTTTSASALEIEGSCSDNGRSILISGSELTTVICADNAFSATFDVSALADGPLFMFASYTDAAGNASAQATLGLIKDTALPTLTISAPAAGAGVNTDNVSHFAVLGGCSEPGQPVVISGDASASVTCDGGVYTAILDFSAADDGPVSITIQHGSGGGLSAVPASRTFNKDSHPPTIAFTSPGLGSGIDSAHVTQLEVAGSCSESGQAVTLLGYATAVVTCVDNAFAATLDFSGAPEGAVFLYAGHIDAAGNRATQAFLPLIKDTAAPSVAISAPAANAFINAAAAASGFTVGGSCSESEQDVVISGSASATVPCVVHAFSAALDFSNASDGPVTVIVNHQDAVGNAAPSGQRTFIKDATLPTVAFTMPDAGTTVVPSTVFAFGVSGSCSENGRSVIISGDASATTTCTDNAWSVSLNFFSLADGPLTLLADHTDAAGNLAIQASRGYVKETIFPGVTIGSPAANSFIGANNVSAFTVSGACSENNRPVVIGGAATANVLCIAGTWSADLNFSSRSDGSVTITVDHSDPQNNAAPQVTRTFIKDALVPSVAVTSPAQGSGINLANQSAITVSGTCSEAGRSVVITGHATASTTCSGGGTWSTTLNFSSAPQGAVSITVSHSDAAGNPAPQYNFALSKDTVAPTVAFTSPSAGAYVVPSNQAAFPLSGSCSENGRNVVISGSASATVACNTAATPNWSTTVNLSASAQGTLTFNVNHSDAAGNAAPQASVSVTKDTISPSAPSLLINSDVDVTSDANVTLTLGASGATQMYVTNTAGCSGDGVWETYATTKAWTIVNLGTDGPPPQGQSNTVYVKFRDAALNESSCVSDSITHETLVSEPIYRTNGAKWNDYVRKQNSIDSYHQSDVACGGTENGSTQTCIHGGELRKVVVVGQTSCAGLTLEEALGAFDWVCRDASSTPAETYATFFSVSLKADKGLADLLNPSAFKENQVTVYKDGTQLRQSASRVWWSNPVTPLVANGGGSDPVSVLSTTSTIYTVSGPLTTQGYNINADRVGIVGLGGTQTLTYGGNSTFNCSTASETSSATTRCLLAAGAQKFLWLEGLDLNGQSGSFSGQVGVSLYATHYSRLWKLTTRNMIGTTAYGFYLQSNTGLNLKQLTSQTTSTYGIFLNSSTNTDADRMTVSGTSLGFHMDGHLNNRISNLTATATTNWGIYSRSMSGGVYTDYKAYGCANGIFFQYGNGTTIRRLTAANNTGEGVQFNGTSGTPAATQLSHVRSYNNGTQGLNASGYNLLYATDIVVANNGAYGLYVSGGVSDVFTQVTSVNNSSHGVYVGSASSTFHNIVSANNSSAGLYGVVNNGNTFSQIVSAHNGTYGVHVEPGAIEYRFTGNLVLGANATAGCYVPAGTIQTPGIVTSTCTVSGATGSTDYPVGYVSNATLRTTPSLAGAFVGKVTSDDSVNFSDTNGTAAYASLTDWMGFTSLFRTWGKDGAAFAASDHRGRCTSGTCRMWDWRLANAAHVLFNRSADASNDNDAYPGTASDPCPPYLNGDRSTFDAMGNRFLLSAIEITGDGIGDEDGLCESNEACLYTPNFGAYQGEGSYNGRSCIYDAASSSITGVTLYAYPSNGI